MSLVALLIMLLGAVSLSLANVEKEIFLGPKSLSMPYDANIDDLYLISLSPKHLTARTRLNATFPTGSHPKGSETWMLLEGLKPGTRYEVRICWLATQPTAFSLHTYTHSLMFKTPELLSSLTDYTNARQATVSGQEVEKLSARRLGPTSNEATVGASLLFLHIYAAADYFSLDKSLMDNVPPVLVDVILDPYLMNIFPESLLPTAAYIAILATLAWFLSGFIWRSLMSIATSDVTTSDKKKD